ncbi:FecR domain-containing protein [bacterium]|nr:FecR domain-containing protein [bacterium]
MKIIITLICLIIFYNNVLLGIDIGKVVGISGNMNLFMKESKTDKGILLKKGMLIKLNHYIQTGKNTTAEINLNLNGMNTTIKVRKNSLIKIVGQINRKKKKGVFLYFGRLFSLFSGKKKGQYAVETYNSVTAVEGTEFEVGYDELNDQTILLVSSGKVKFIGKIATIPGIPQIKRVIKNQISVIEKGKNIKIFKDPTSEEYKSYFNKLQRIENSKTGLLLEEENKNADEVEFAGLSPNEKIDGECDDTNGISFVLQLLQKKRYDDKSSIPLQSKAYIWINECNYFNEKQLVYKGGKPIEIKNLPREIHKVNILCGGYQSEFDIDLSEENGNRSVEKVYYIELNLYFVDKVKDVRLSREEVCRLNLSLNDQKLLIAKKDKLQTSGPEYLNLTNSPVKTELYLPLIENNFTISVSSKKFESTSVEIELDGNSIPHLISLDLKKEK